MYRQHLHIPKIAKQPAERDATRTTLTRSPYRTLLNIFPRLASPSLELVGVNVVCVVTIDRVGEIVVVGANDVFMDTVVKVVSVTTVVSAAEVVETIVVGMVEVVVETTVAGMVEVVVDTAVVGMVEVVVVVARVVVTIVVDALT